MARLQKRKIKLGLDKILESPKTFLADSRIGLICNQASVNRDFIHAADLFFDNSDIKLTTLFGPQHGIRGDVQDNMIETSHSVDYLTGLPIYSLYSETRIPTAEMLANVDVIVFDLQDVGCRVYTFIYTMANAMIAAAKFGKKFVVLDRPNPINGIDVEGNILETGHESFVGQYQIPMRHGLTCGELAKLFNTEFKIGCDLEIIAMDGWNREDYADETDAPWVLPSPNMPTVETAVVFPATVIFEGTKISEGRGTTRPFEFIGASYIDAKQFSDKLNSLNLSGVYFRDVSFLPTFQKEAGKTCGGVFVHVTNRDTFRSVITGIAMLKTLFDMYPDKFEWKNPPYEYVYDRNPFDVVMGTDKTRISLENGESLESIEKSWEDGVAKFKELRESYLIY